VDENNLMDEKYKKYYLCIEERGSAGDSWHSSKIIHADEKNI
jgi:hypothetical protein